MKPRGQLPSRKRHNQTDTVSTIEGQGPSGYAFAMDAGGFWQAFTSWLGGFINWWNTLGAGNLAEAGAAVGTVAALFWMASAHAREMRRNRVAEGMASIESERRAAKERKGLSLIHI